MDMELKQTAQMKKIMYMAVAAIAVLSSCSSEEFTQSSNGNNGEAKVFTGTIDNEPGTRTSYSYDSSAKTGKVSWNESDKVSINGAVYTVAPKEDATQATFNHESGTAPTTAPYTAFYADGANSGTYFNGSTITLPSSYTYDASNSFNMPMYAHNESDTKLSFKNICGVLAITIPTDGLQVVTKTAVKSITVTSDKAIAGTCTINSDNEAVVESSSTTKTITLNLGDGVNVSSEAKTFYLPIPKGDHSLTISVSDGNISEEISTSSTATVERNKVYKVSFSGAKRGTAKTSGGQTVPWVQLWSGGPRFATFNVGATITDYKDANSTSSEKSDKYKSPDYVGGYYGWGGSTSCSSTDYYSGTEYDANGNLKSDYDTATKLWGSNWRMPTKDELSNLGASVTISSGTGKGTYCKWTWCSGETGSRYVEGCTLAGYKIEGLDAYASNSVFFPAAGYYNGSVYNQGDGGDYWSSTPDDAGGAGGAYGLYFLSSGQVVLSSSRSCGRSVRAVLK